MQCVVYKSIKKEGYYMYLDAQKQLEDVPENLLALLGTLEKVMDLELTPDKKLAQASVSNVIAQLQSQGYYLQMPPKDFQQD